MISLSGMVKQHILPYFIKNFIIYDNEYNPPLITSPLKGTGKVHLLEDHMGHQQEVLKPLKDNLVIAKNRNKQVDQYYSEREFEVWDWLLFRLQPYK